MGWARTTVLSDSYGESLHLSPRARDGVQASCDLDVELHVLEQYAIYILRSGVFCVGMSLLKPWSIDTVTCVVLENS